jgi:carboxypeptidase C (cathepsin A)
MGAAEAEAAGKAGADGAEPKRFVTRHAIEIGGESLAYRAVAGETFLRTEDGAPEASVFSIAYLLDGVEDPDRRPIAFFFNGGPGSTAIWLHLGAFGPRRLVLEDMANPGAPPYELAPNPHTLLPATDMVFVDPIGTGYSRALGEGEDSDYWGVDEDAASMARFIRTYLTETRRWGSPKYLVGESYGTIRSSLLVRELQLDLLDSTALNGVVLLSSALDVGTFVPDAPGHDLVYVATLPTFTAIAHYHGKLPGEPGQEGDLEALLAEARRFASTDYLLALFEGDALPEERARRIAGRLHRLTGLSEEYLLRSHLRVTIDRFAKELLRDDGTVIGLHDGRAVGRDPTEAGESVEWDPFVLSIAGPFGTVINDYLAEDLEADFGRRYELFDLRIPQSWKRPGNEQWTGGALNVVPYLAAAVAANDEFRVFVASGYHDLVTAFFGTEHTFGHSGIPEDRITLRNYFGGHMMYLHDPSLEALSRDVRAFIDER